MKQILGEFSPKKQLLTLSFGFALEVLHHPLALQARTGLVKNQGELFQVKRFGNIVRCTEPYRFNRRLDSSLTGH